jgi:hypothetical protein
MAVRKIAAVLAPAALAFAIGTSPGAEPGRFTSEASCASTSCHGGGKANGQCLTWENFDVHHTRAPAILGVARSARIAENLGIPDASKDSRCTLCHDPLQSMPAKNFAPAVNLDIREKGVSCETCHGPAESWLRFHTRPDVTHEQIIAAGMRDMRDLYHRANVCVSCHVNVDPELVQNGHPELDFELDGQMVREPPHWRELENDPWFGPRAWLTGQAVGLRELAWKSAARPTDTVLINRQKGLLWLLQRASLGARDLKETDPALSKTLQASADHFAQAASKEPWTRERTRAVLLELASTGDSFTKPGLSKEAKEEQRRRAESLVPAMDRLYRALIKNGTTPSTDFEKALQNLSNEVALQDALDLSAFGADVQKAKAALQHTN